jgi:hypothetical protein
MNATEQAPEVALESAEAGDCGIIRRVDPTRDPGWDKRLLSSPASTFFHTSAWASVLADTYGFEPIYFLIEHGDGGRSVVPLMGVSSWLTGKRAVSLPFTDECPPLCRDRRSLRVLFADILQFGALHGWRHVEIRGGREPLGVPVSSTVFRGHSVELQTLRRNSLSAVDPSVRQAVRKAVRSGVSVEYADSPAAVSEFYGLLCQTRLRHGSPPPPFRFFESIRRHIIAPGKGWLALARKDGRAIAGAIFLIHADRAIFKFGASDEAHLGLRPNNLVMWDAMVRLADAGMKSMDLGRTSVANEGLRRFKLSLGATERTIEYLRFDLRLNAYVTAPDRSSAGYNRFLARLPAPIFRAMGAALYRHAA